MNTLFTTVVLALFAFPAAELANSSRAAVAVPIGGHAGSATDTGPATRHAENSVPPGSIVTYDTSIFLPNPPGCDAYLHGDADGHTYWRGCNTNGCAPLGVDCLWKEEGAGLRCECPDQGGAGMAMCWALVLFASDNQTVTGVICTENGCGHTCDRWLWWAGNFYPCNC